MTTIVRGIDGTIKTYGEFTLDMYNRSLNESIEFSNESSEQYSKRFQLFVDGFVGQNFSCHVTDLDLVVYVKTSLPLSSVDVDINGVIDTVELADGQGKIILALDTAGTYIIQPADRTKFCASGSGLLMVEVLSNE